jgi:hypothetical protein
MLLLLLQLLLFLLLRGRTHGGVLEEKPTEIASITDRLEDSDPISEPPQKALCDEDLS